MAKEKKKKDKVIYVDDGRTIADMSGVPGTRLGRDAWRTHSTGREKWDTYWGAVKRMFVPMLVVIVAICVIYMILWLYFVLMH